MSFSYCSRKLWSRLLSRSSRYAFPPPPAAISKGTGSPFSICPRASPKQQLLFIQVKRKARQALTYIFVPIQMTPNYFRMSQKCLSRQALSAVHMAPFKATRKAVMDVFKDVFETRQDWKKRKILPDICMSLPHHHLRPLPTSRPNHHCQNHLQSQKTRPDRFYGSWCSSVHM